MNPFASVLFATFVAGVLSVLLAGAFLLAPERLRKAAIPPLVSFSIGSLLGAAFLGLLPEAFESVGPGRGRQVGGMAVAGLIVFFLVEKYVLWRHCHRDGCDRHPIEPRPTAGALVVAGDTLHNFIDGVIIAAAFLSDPKLGAATAVAVASHELPQEMGDFAVLLHSGFSRRSALLFNVASGAAMILGGAVGWVGLSVVQPAAPFLIAFAASGFIYVAVADLIPEQHRRLGLKASLQQLLLIALGVGVVYGVQLLAR